MDQHYPLTGGCSCGAIRYQIETAPMIVHCCHCTWCQRETGSAFVLNALIEAERVTLLKGAPVCINTPSASGKGQKIWRCPHCQVALWSNYAGSGDKVRFVRIGTLDHPGTLPPDIHIYTSTKLDWVTLPDGVPAVEEYYRLSEVWSPESIERKQRLFPK
ncbi:GFA family protein [Cohaesibacter haloalkalitolerans]|uniref:GFA family protein n=1 Tax=Cohaesibacter haloalkalitolerans TaxID=1162980 RepID=UPI001FE21D64|nr:GFA family protein [Cohaesibacter haloalkalitolerans]